MGSAGESGGRHWWGVMEGGRAMEGRGSGVEDWRGEAHLGSLLPVSPCHCPCPLVVSCVHTSWPVSARRCLCLRVVAHVHVLLPVSTRVACGPRVVPHIRSRLWAVVFVCGHGRLSSFGGVCLRSWAVHLHSWATAGCGHGEPLVGGGESSGLV